MASKLDAYASEIRRLVLDGRTLREIQEWLAAADPPCLISIARLHAWIVSLGEPKTRKWAWARYKEAVRRRSEDGGRK